jgi:hypothetical protein
MRTATSPNHPEQVREDPPGRPAGSGWGLLSVRAMATVPVPYPAERRGPRRQEIHEDRDSPRHPKCLFDAFLGAEVEGMLGRTVEKYSRERHSGLANWMEENLLVGFTVYDIVKKDFARRRLRTTNMVEFQNKELKKRTCVIRVFSNKEALQRLASALLVELDDKWLSETKAQSDFFSLAQREFTEKSLCSLTTNCGDRVCAFPQKCRVKRNGKI